MSDLIYTLNFPEIGTHREFKRSVLDGRLTIMCWDCRREFIPVDDETHCPSCVRDCEEFHLLLNSAAMALMGRA